MKLTDEGRVFVGEVTPMLEELARIARPPAPPLSSKPQAPAVT
ncbi:hypothetical protein [Azospirillum endophyticum]